MIFKACEIFKWVIHSEIVVVKVLCILTCFWVLEYPKACKNNLFLADTSKCGFYLCRPNIYQLGDDVGTATCLRDFKVQNIVEFQRKIKLACSLRIAEKCPIFSTVHCAIKNCKSQKLFGKSRIAVGKKQ